MEEHSAAIVEILEQPNRARSSEREISRQADARFQGLRSRSRDDRPRGVAASHPTRAMIEELRKVIKRMHYPPDVMIACVRWYAGHIR
jgi:hypothetical protein